MNEGTVVAISIAAEPGGVLQSLDEAAIVAGRGIVGDRYYLDESKEPRQSLTLIEAEQIERFNESATLNIEPFETRRNVVTRGVSLNDLVGIEFELGAVVVRGEELCEPCMGLANRLVSKFSISSISPSDIVGALTHRAGLRVSVLHGGQVRVGDPIRLRSTV
ncbi:MAG: MOSC domain-containing protein [Planctomycetota bacterium]|jgi:MOSC domain-containing protein YiiM